MSAHLLLLILVGYGLLVDRCFAYEVYGFGQLESNYFSGKREGYLNTLTGLVPETESGHWLQNRGNAGFYWRNRIEKLDLTLRDTLQFSVLDHNTLQRRTSSWDNVFEAMGLLHFTGPAFVRGAVRHAIFEDKRDPQFSYDDLTGSLAIERQLDSNRRIGAGVSRRDVNFDQSRADDFVQNDIFVNFLRFSTPRIYKVLRRTGPTSSGRALMSRHFSEGDREILREDRFKGAAIMAHESEGELGEEVLVKEEEGGLVFEAEYRMRDTDLFNNLARSYLENQFHVRTRLYFHADHAITIANSYSMRDYQEQVIADRILNQERNLSEINWYYASGSHLFDQTLRSDYVFFERFPDRDYHIMEWEGTWDWDLQRNWMAGIFHSWQRRKYDTPREFYTDTDINFASLYVHWKFRRSWEASWIRDWERRKVSKFETVIDSSFSLDGTDFRISWAQSPHLKFHVGYRMEEERHDRFFTNDRNESLAYGGTKVEF